MSRKLDDLTYVFRRVVFELLARLLERGYLFAIIDTLRTEEEQIENVKKGVSWTLLSKHLPQAPDNLSWAIDLCPYGQYNLHGPDKLQWDATDPAWAALVEEAKKLGLVCGAEWKVKDMGHIEMPKAMAIKASP